MIRVFLADDHTIVREGLRELLSGVPDLRVVGEAADGPDTLQELGATACDVLVLDLSMPGLGGTELIRAVQEEYPGLPMLVLSMHAEQDYAVRALRAGAYGYLPKTAAVGQLVEAIRRVADGELFLNPELAQDLALHLLIDDELEPHTRLSPKERTVFELLVRGRSVSEIAETMQVSVKTVSTHKARVLEKMRLGSVAALVRYAVDNDLLPPDSSSDSQ